ncbi:MAG: hypothetical protein ACLTDR_15145 [Adlercreutzia equolifaciens]
MADASALAKAAGVQVDIVWDTTTEVAHPSTVDIAARAARGAPWRCRGRLHRGATRRSFGASWHRQWTSPGQRTSVVAHQPMSAGCSPHHRRRAGRLRHQHRQHANLHRHGQARRTPTPVLETDSAVDASVRELLMDHPDIINARVIPATCAGDGEEVPVPRMPRSGSPLGLRIRRGLLALCEREARHHRPSLPRPRGGAVRQAGHRGRHRRLPRSRSGSDGQRRHRALGQPAALRGRPHRRRGGETAGGA